MQPDTTVYPPVQPGMLVHWYFAGDTREAPCPMLVTKVGEYALEGSVIVPGQATFSGKTGVLHVSRPEVGNYHRRDNGAWDYTPEMKALYQRLEALEQGPVGKNPSKELAARVKALEEMLEELTRPQPAAA